jgi:cysteine desulfurase/selenocysteine lyase
MIYLDNAATSFPKPEQVYRAMDEFARTMLGNPGRSGHRMAIASERVLEETRHCLNVLFHGEAPERFILTFNCTDSLNMALKGVLNEGDHVVTSVLEHNSVSRPLVAMERAGYITLTRVPVESTGQIDPDDVRRAVRPNTRLIVLTHASNVLGTVQPVAEVGAIARELDLLFLVDAAQTAGVVPIDVRAMNIDLLAFPGHKALLGPTGTGGLYVGPRATVRPWREGGTGGDSTWPTQPEELPYRLEGGTPNVHGIVGLRAGVQYVLETGMEKIRNHELDLVESLAAWIQESGHYRLVVPFDRRRQVATLSFISPSLSAAEVGQILDEAFGIAVRPGLHCAPYTHRAIGTFPEGTVRVSPGPFNSADDMAALCSALEQIASEAARL